MLSTIVYSLIGQAVQRRGRAAPRGEAPKSVQLHRNFSPQRRDLDAAAASPRGEAAKSVQLRRLFWSQRRVLDAAVASPRGEAAKSVQLRRFFWPPRLGRLASRRGARCHGGNVP